MTHSKIAATMATPSMAFSLDATKMRQDWQGRPDRYLFESPVTHLMKDYGYRDLYAGGGERSGPPASRKGFKNRPRLTTTHWE